MRIFFTKMQGAGNDFIVLDETRGLLGLAPAHYRWLAHRHFGVGADQILSVRAASHSGVDFAYVIHNADGQEVEHCGNGARCFVRYVHEKGLSHKNPLRVQTQKTVIELQAMADGSVRVDMGAPFFDHADIPFIPPTPFHSVHHPTQGLSEGALALWPLADTGVDWSVLSMGNPHAVARFDDITSLDLAALGALVQANLAFPNGVNVGAMQILSQHEIKLRVFERGVGETLACGTGACAAVVAGICHGWLAPAVKVQTRGGVLHIEWNPSSGKNAPVMMAGPAVTVFDAVIDIPELM